MSDPERVTSEQLSPQERLRILVGEFQEVATKEGKKDERVVEALQLYWRITACRSMVNDGWNNFSTEVAGVLFSMSAKKNGRVVRGKPMSDFVREHFESDTPFLLEGLEGDQMEMAEKFCQKVIDRLKDN